MTTQTKPFNVWAKIMLKDKIIKEHVFCGLKKISYDEIFAMLQESCEKLDLSCPVLLETHINHIKEFRRFSFLPDDFIEPVEFSRFEVELYR